MVTEDSSREAWLRQARSYLRNADPVLARLIDDRPGFDLAEARLDSPYRSLATSYLFSATFAQAKTSPAAQRKPERVAPSQLASTGGPG